MSALRWGSRRDAPSAPHIHVHTCKATPNAPDQVAFLGDPEELEAHYLRPSVQQRGGSVPCAGPGCQFCINGLPTLRNYYAPALLLRPGCGLNGRELWERVVYYVPQGAVAGFTSGIGRGKVFAVWRLTVGAVTQMRSRFIARVPLGEPVFDVRPVLEHLYAPTAATKSALEAVFAALPVNVTPPVLHPPRDEKKPDPEVLALLEKARGIKPINTEAEARKLAEEKLTFKGESIAQRKANGTYNPGSNGQHEGGDK